MRPRRVLLLASVLAGALSAFATLFDESRMALQSGAVALAALAVLALLSNTTAGRVRVALAAGLGLLALVMVLELRWLAEPSATSQLLVPSYSPLDGSPAPSPHPSALLDEWQEGIDRNRAVQTGELVGLLALAYAVAALPPRRRTRRALLARILAVLVLVAALAEAWGDLRDAPLTGALGVAWSALLAVLVAAVVLALSGARSDRFGLLPLGALLVAGVAAVDLGHLVGTWSSWWWFAEASRNAYLTYGVAVDTGLDISPAVEATVALAGPALLTLGALRAGQDDRGRGNAGQGDGGRGNAGQGDSGRGDAVAADGDEHDGHDGHDKHDGPDDTGPAEST